MDQKKWFEEEGIGKERLKAEMEKGGISVNIVRHLLSIQPSCYYHDPNITKDNKNTSHLLALLISAFFRLRHPFKLCPSHTHTKCHTPT